MKLFQNFSFSQSSLQDFSTCPKKFYLRYIQKLTWPAQQTKESLDMEVHIHRGARFHHLIHQYFLGIPLSKLNQIAESDPYPEFHLWWESFQEFMKIEPENQYFPELTLQTPIAGSNLIAKFDLVKINGNNLTIFDWKTSQKQPKREILLKRLQTRVYLYMITKEYSSLVESISIQPENIQMIYWQAIFPEHIETINYSTAALIADEKYLSHLIQQIGCMEDEDFIKTNNDRACSYCNYRSLCDKGIVAGSINELDADPEQFDLSTFDIDLDQIEEIRY